MFNKTMLIPDYMDEPHWLRIGRLTVEVMLALFGVVGNIAVIIAIARCPFMRTVTNIFICNLAVADLGVLLFSFPFAVVKEQTLFYWPLGKALCQIAYPLSEVFIGVSVWSIAFISVDRYRGIVNDSHLRSMKVARIICFISWIISFLVLCLPLLIVTSYWEGSGFKDCIQEWPSQHPESIAQGYTFVCSFHNYVLPLSIILWTYFKIFRKLGNSTAFNKSTRRAKNLRDSSSSRHDEQRIKRNNRAKKILTPVVVVFAVTLLPVNVFRLMLTCMPSLLYFHYLWVLYNLCVIASVLNSSCNPFIYAVVSDNFRMAFRKMLGAKEKFARRRAPFYAHLCSPEGATTTFKLHRNASPKSTTSTNFPIVSTGSLSYSSDQV